MDSIIFSSLAIIVILIAVVVGFNKRFSYTNILVVANLLVFMLILLAPPMPGHLTAVQTDLGFKPTDFFNGRNLYTVFTNLFIHLDFFHVIGNMLFLFLIGNAYEERVGKNKFVATYFVAGVAGTLVESVLLSGSPGGVDSVLIGASGAIAGVMGAMLLLYPRDKVPMFLVIIFLPAVSVWLAVGSWFAWQLLLVTQSGLIAGGIGFGAHFGGFLAGMLVAHLYPQSMAKSPKAVDVAGLESLATTKELKDALEHIRGETNPDIRNAWLEYFAEHSACPKCGAHPKWKGNNLKCSCGFDTQLK